MIKRQQQRIGCQTNILRNEHMTTTSCYHFTTYLPVYESSNTHVQSHAISAIPPLLYTHTHTHSTMQVRKERRRGITTLFEMLNVVCSKDVNIPQEYQVMIRNVHFGDTRYDLTPVTTKWLPNDHTEEQTTTRPTRTITATHYTALTQYTFALRNG